MAIKKENFQCDVFHFIAQITAAQWKNWGNELNQERKFGLMADYYSLAIDFTPHSEDELLTALLSNRSLAHVNLKNYNKALEDARECMRIRPQWFRVSKSQASSERHTQIFTK